MLILAAFLLLVSAHLLVQVTHQARSQQVRLQTLEGERDALQVEWGRLLLEESALVTPVRLEQLAAERFDLHLPEAPDLQIKVIQ
jgi:cell division protein FtsL